jgi:hypothetical protein
MNQYIWRCKLLPPIESGTGDSVPLYGPEGGDLAVQGGAGGV